MKEHPLINAMPVILPGMFSKTPSLRFFYLHFVPMCYRMLANVKQPPHRWVFLTVSAFHFLDLGISLKLGVCQVASLGGTGGKNLPKSPPEPSSGLMYQRCSSERVKQQQLG